MTQAHFQKVFQGNGETFSALYQAEKWLRENGYSVGPTSIDGPQGVAKGDIYIPKWRNMTRKQISKLDGTLRADREGPAWLFLKEPPAPLPELHLNLKGEYFDDINQGRKPEEYRLVTPYWKKRLEDRQYSAIVIKRGYPKADDPDRNIRRVWSGVIRKTITHPHFGPNPVEVFAIDVSESLEEH